MAELKIVGPVNVAQALAASGAKTMTFAVAQDGSTVLSTGDVDQTSLNSASKVTYDAHSGEGSHVTALRGVLPALEAGTATTGQVQEALAALAVHVLGLR